MFRKILSFYTKYFAIWVIVCGVLAYFWPGPLVKLGSFKLTDSLNINKLFFSVTMFGIGAVLQIEDFKRIAQRPVIVLVGCCAQYSIMPIGACIVARLLNLPPEIAAGLILTGSAPGAMASNVMSYVAGADTAYSVSLTTVSTLLCPILTPGLTYLLASSSMDISFWAMVADIMIMVIIPLLIGFAVRHFFTKGVEKILPIFPAISVTFIIFICSFVIAANKTRLADVTLLILLGVFALNIYGMSAGYGIGSLFKMEQKRRKTLAIEIGMQNAGMGVVLAKEHLGDQATIPAAFFVFVCIITASSLAAHWKVNSANNSPDLEKS
jgi:BASS family bile acid:Na+ symporter